LAVVRAIRAALAGALLASFALAACRAGAKPWAPSGAHGADAHAAEAPWRYPGLRYRGMALGLWDAAAPTTAPTIGARLDEVAAIGVDSLLVPVFWRQHDVTSVDLAADPAVTLPDDTLRAVLAAARARDLRVLLLPIVHLDVIAPGVWRGTLAPKDVDAWWQAYRRFVLHYAALARSEGVAILSVGSELGATEAWRDRWYALIGEVRRVFPGELTYSANWDHYQHVSFWERLDAVGISAYPPLTTDADAGEDELDQAWRAAGSELAGFARRVGRPLIITELGIPSIDGGATAPWDYTRRAPVDLEEQRRAFAAFARAFADEPALAGVFVWIWWGEGGADDPGYSVRRKPAAEVIRRMYRPGAP
jgi:hypothetical protein